MKFALYIAGWITFLIGVAKMVKLFIHPSDYQTDVILLLSACAFILTGTRCFAAVIATDYL